MKFIIREAFLEDASIIFDMAQKFHAESKLREEVFINTLEKFKKNCFIDNPKVHFFIAEFKGSILGYCSYFDSYSLLTGASVIIHELYIEKEYRKLGISIFLYSKVFDIAFNKNSHLIKWIINMLEKQHIAIEEQIGVKIDKDTMILNITNKNILKFLNMYSKTEFHQIRLAKTYELPEIFDCIKNLAIENKESILTDVYKLMDAAFSSNPKISILVYTNDDHVKGVLSFYDGYYSSIGKILMIDKVFVLSENRHEKIGLSLLKHLFEYAHKNGYNKIELNISKFDIEKVENLKELGIYPYSNLRVAKYYKKEYLELYK